MQELVMNAVVRRVSSSRRQSAGIRTRYHRLQHRLQHCRQPRHRQEETYLSLTRRAQRHNGHFDRIWQ